MALKVQIIDSLLSIDEKVWDSCANSVEIQSLLGVPGERHLIHLRHIGS